MSASNKFWTPLTRRDISAENLINCYVFWLCRAQMLQKIYVWHYGNSRHFCRRYNEYVRILVCTSADPEVYCRVLYSRFPYPWHALAKIMTQAFQTQCLRNHTIAKITVHMQCWPLAYSWPGLYSKCSNRVEDPRSARSPLTKFERKQLKESSAM